MEHRLKLHAILCEILGCPETGDECRAFFQGPNNTLMKYDCIRYSRSKIDSTFADNMPYQFYDRYQLTVIYRNPDSDIPKKVARLPMCSHERHYLADNLHHDIFNIYF